MTDSRIATRRSDTVAAAASVDGRTSLLAATSPTRTHGSCVAAAVQRRRRSRPVMISIVSAINLTLHRDAELKI